MVLSHLKHFRQSFSSRSKNSVHLVQDHFVLYTTVTYRKQFYKSLCLSKIILYKVFTPRLSSTIFLIHRADFNIVLTWYGNLRTISVSSCGYASNTSLACPFTYWRRKNGDISGGGDVGWLFNSCPGKTEPSCQQKNIHVQGHSDILASIIIPKPTVFF